MLACSNLYCYGIILILSLPAQARYTPGQGNHIRGLQINYVHSIGILRLFFVLPWGKLRHPETTNLM